VHSLQTECAGPRGDVPAEQVMPLEVVVLGPGLEQELRVACPAPPLLVPLEQLELFEAPHDAAHESRPHSDGRCHLLLDVEPVWVQK